MHSKCVSSLMPLLIALYMSLVIPLPAQSQNTPSSEKPMLDVPKKLQSLITKDKLEEIAVSPCNGAVSYLVTQYIQNPDVPKALDALPLYVTKNLTY